jgi:hypothetical protein
LATPVAAAAAAAAAAPAAGSGCCGGSPGSLASLLPDTSDWQEMVAAVTEVMLRVQVSC